MWLSMGFTFYSHENVPYTHWKCVQNTRGHVFHTPRTFFNMLLHENFTQKNSCDFAHVKLCVFFCKSWYVFVCQKGLSCFYISAHLYYTCIEISHIISAFTSPPNTFCVCVFFLLSNVIFFFSRLNTQHPLCGWIVTSASSLHNEYVKNKLLFTSNNCKFNILNWRSSLEKWNALNC